MNKREQTSAAAKAWHRVRMKRALRQAGYPVVGDEATDFLEELVITTFAPSVQQFEGVVARAKEAIE